MDIKALFLGEYSQFVWPAFLFTFLSCSYLFFITKKELDKHAKMFLNEFDQFQTIKIETIKKKASYKKSYIS